MVQTDSSSYVELLQKFPPRPIETEKELDAVQQGIDALLDSNDITLDKQDYINLLGILIHEYEERRVSIPRLTGIELLKALMNELGLQQQDLVPVFKTESIASEVLAGRCPFTVEQVEKLAEFFRVSPSVFLDRSSKLI